VVVVVNAVVYVIVLRRCRRAPDMKRTIVP